MAYYHVHIYQVSSLVERDIEAESEEEAQDKALNDGMLFGHTLHPSDCKHIAMAFPVNILCCTCDSAHIHGVCTCD